MKKINKTCQKTTSTKTTASKIILAFAMLSFITSLVSCTTDEVEPVNTNVVIKQEVFNVQFSQRDSIPSTGKPTDSIPLGEEIIPPPIKK